jgi:signal transduction histidine kinase
MEARVLDGDGAKVAVRIEDQGIGIAPEDLGNVFDRNFRAQNAVSHRADGSGLGLSIARTLARGHGGDVSITSHAERGTTAVVTLPLASKGKVKSVA